MENVEETRNIIEEIWLNKKAAVNCFDECDKIKSKNLRKRILWETRALHVIKDLKQKVDNVNIRLSKIQKLQDLRIIDDIDNKSTSKSDVSTSNLINSENIKKSEIVPKQKLYDNNLHKIYMNFKKCLAEIDHDNSESNKKFIFCSTDGSTMEKLIKAVPDDLSNIFTPEEVFGHAVDLTEAYSIYINWEKYKNYRKMKFRQQKIAEIIIDIKTQRSLKHTKNVKVNLSNMNANMIRSSSETSSDESESDNEDLINFDDPKVREMLEFQETSYTKFLELIKSKNFFYEIPEYIKYKSTPYRNFLDNVWNTFWSNYKRVNPFLDESQILIDLKNSFEAAWSNQNINWYKKSVFDNPFYSKILDVVAESMQSKVDLDSSSKAIRKKSKLDTPEKFDEFMKVRQAKCLEIEKTTVQKEFEIFFILDRLESVLAFTIDRVKAKRSGADMSEWNNVDSDSAGNLDYSEEEKDDFNEIKETRKNKKIKNPLKLPIDLDGNPIPYWLFKLHGFNQVFICEICGNAKYNSSKVFQNHFSSWKHSYGMKCLKIPNTEHFKNISKISEALELFAKLKEKADRITFDPDDEAEVEDVDGNIMTKKTYEDLVKQGLL